MSITLTGWPESLKTQYQQAREPLDEPRRRLLDHLLVGDDFELNAEQASGLLHDHGVDGPCLLLAGAGSGKTAVMTRRIVYLYLQGYGLDEVWAVTFTNKAAKEMRERVEEILCDLWRVCGDDSLSEAIQRMIDRLGDGWIGTFHSLGRRMLEMDHPKRNHPIVSSISHAYKAPIHLMEPDKQRRLVTRLYQSRIHNPNNYSQSALWDQVVEWRRELIVPRRAEDQASNDFERAAAQLYLRYQQAKRSDRPAKLDFQDLLIFPVQLCKEKQPIRDFWQSRFQHVLIDEFQDTNALQFGLAKQLSDGHGRLFAVGDDAQAIYGWRGADIRNIQKFKARFADATVRRLTRNYRSSATIVMSANDVFKSDPTVYEKDLSPGRGDERGLEYGKDVAVVPCRSGREERGWLGYEIRRLINKRGYDPGDLAIFYRINQQGKPIKRYLERTEIPHVELGESRFFDLPAVHYIRCVYRCLEAIHLARTRGKLENTDSYTKALTEWWSRPSSGWADSFSDQILTHPSLIKVLVDDEVRASFIECCSAENQALLKKELKWFEGMYEQVVNGATVSSCYDGIAERIDFSRSNNLCELTDNVRTLCSEWIKHTENTPGIHGLVEFLKEVKQQTRGSQFVPGNPARFVKLSTLHGVKGLEFPVVFFTGLEEGVCPYKHPSQSKWNDERLQEEKRLFYVGITRAQERLNLLWARQREWFGSLQSFKRSRFLDLIPRDLSVKVAPPRSWTQEVAGWFVR